MDIATGMPAARMFITYLFTIVYCQRKGRRPPLEAAILGASVLTGPYIENFKEAYRVLLSAQGNEPISTSEKLAQEIVALLSEPAMATQRGERAKNAVSQLAGALERSLDAAEELLTRHARA